jgi:lysophospholipase
MPTFTTPDNAKIHYHHWTPQGDPKAVVVIVHGIGEHGARYTHVAQAMNAAGYVVVAPDHRGHGNSDGERAHFDSFDLPVRDLHQLIQSLETQYRQLPVFMYGHSMGSGIALLYTLEYQRELKGLILSGTVVSLEDGQNPVVLAIGGLVGRFFPKSRIVPQLPSSTLSTDPAVVRDYDADPLNDHGKVRIGMAHKMIQLGRDVRSRAHMLTLPLLILHGEDDKLTPISGSRAIYESASSPDKTLKTYPGLRHELVNEVGREEIIALMVSWLDKH